MRSVKIIIAVVAALVLFSCATKRKVEYVDREVVRYETKVLHDTLVKNERDSVYHVIFQKGDTVYDTKYVERIRNVGKSVVRYDTVYMDSIQVKVKETVTIKNMIPKWCYFSLAVWAALIIFAIIKIKKWTHWV